MKWKVLLFAFLLIAAATVIGIATTTDLTGTANSCTIDDFKSFVLNGNCTTTGGGDPLPGGGIPT